eukprot:635934_1
MKTISLPELAKHQQENDCWVAVEGRVYDVTKFLSDHPGGKKVLLKECGKDATKKFNLFHDESVLGKYGPRLQIGFLPGHEPSIVKTPISSDGSSFGDLMPYAEPNWYGDFNSPYYNDSHRKWRKIVRTFSEEHIIPNVNKWEENYQISREVYRKAGENLLMAGICSHKWPTEYVGPAPVENYDMFHLLISVDEFSRCGSGGAVWGLFGGLIIGLPPILNFGSQYLKDRVVKDCLLGRKVICLCISEPWTASDVAAFAQLLVGRAIITSFLEPRNGSQTERLPTISRSRCVPGRRGVAREGYR